MPAGLSLSLAPFRDLSTRPAQRAELKALGARYDTQRKRSLSLSQVAKI